jgi:PKD repeat protein
MTVVMVISTTLVHAQLSDHSLPESFLSGLKNASILPVKQLDSVRVQKMQKADQQAFIDNRYGVIEPCQVNIREEGIKTPIEGKGTIWQYRVSSADAYSLGLYFKDYHLPPQAKLFVYDPSGSRLRGAFTNRNNHASAHELTLADFPGRDLIIEYFEPLAAEFPGELILGGISQAYVNIDSLVNNTISVNCPAGQDLKDQKNSVCLMTYHDRLYSYFCTGTLMNNVRQDLTPYFLTANHCIRNELMANSLITYFNYENSLCDSYDAVATQTLSGATMKASSLYTDFSLLLLEEYPPEEYHPYYAGWDARGDHPLQGVCIHHPGGGPKSLAIDSMKINNYPYKAQWFYDGVATLPNTHWSADFKYGSVEMGSSGAPLFDHNKRMVGQLHGGANEVFLFGKLSLSWDYNPNHTSQLAHWLDPDSTSQKVMDGTWRIAPTAKFRVQNQRVCPDLPVTFFDQSSMDPISWLWKITPGTYSFVNGTDSTSQNPQIAFRGEGFYTVTLNVANTHGCDEKTVDDYIYSKRKLDVKLIPVNEDNVICGCDLKSFPIVAQGSILYDFEVGKPGEFEVKHIADTLFLTLNSAITHSFDAWIKIVRPNDYCVPNDSMLIHVLIPPNDSIKNAIRLHLGLNEGFTNRCATVEKNEPHPYSVNCLEENSWCRSMGNDYNILDNSVWFTFMAPSNGQLTIDSQGFDDQIAVYEATTDSSNLKSTRVQYKLIAANDNRSLTDNSALLKNLVLQPGKEYHLQVDGNNAAHGNLGIILLNNSLEIYPNPSTGLVKLMIPNTEPGLADVMICDLSGRRLFSRQYTVTKLSNTFIIDLSNCARGVYLLNVRINGWMLSKKLVVL